MSQAKHTRGPWMQDADRPYDILLDDRDGEGVTIVTGLDQSIKYISAVLARAEGRHP